MFGLLRIFDKQFVLAADVEVLSYFVIAFSNLLVFSNHREVTLFDYVNMSKWRALMEYKLVKSVLLGREQGHSMSLDSKLRLVL